MAFLPAKHKIYMIYDKPTNACSVSNSKPALMGDGLQVFNHNLPPTPMAAIPDVANVTWNYDAR